MVSFGLMVMLDMVILVCDVNLMLMILHVNLMLIPDLDYGNFGL